MTTLRGAPVLKVRRSFAAIAFLLVGCNITDSRTPDEKRFVNMTVLSGGEQVGLPEAQLEPIVVRLRSTVGAREPLANYEVRFLAPAGSGIIFTPAIGFTDAQGMITAQVRLGSALGRYNAEVDFTGNPGSPTPITLEAAQTPVISDVSPGTVAAGGVLVINGSNFSTQSILNEVRVDGARAEVIEANNSRLEVRLPACIPSRTAKVTVNRGALISPPSSVSITAVSGDAIAIARGQAVTVTNRNALSCVRLGSQAAAAEYLVITQHSANTGDTQVPLRLVGMRHGTTAATRPMTALDESALQPATDGENVRAFRNTLRKREAEILSRMSTLPSPPSARRVTAEVPKVGDSRTFKVFVPMTPSPTIRAVVRAVGNRVVIYEDTAAIGLIPQPDIDKIVASLDDPVFTTDVQVFGAASDIDQNERVIVLLTPYVNKLTKANETSFIGGYFYSCDLVSTNECFESNRAEILYSIVPDPDGKWGLKHPVQRVVNLLPPLAAHELAHLIHFNQRALIAKSLTPEELWLSEGLAHFAEDTVASILRSRGLTAEADVFGRENLVRAAMYLSAPEKTSLVASTGEATVEERGAGWLFLKYMNYRVGGTFLRRVQASQATGANNVAGVAGSTWANLMRDWSIALYATGAQELTGVALPPEQTFGSFDLRSAVGGVSSSGYTLKPTDAGDGDFSVDWTMTPSATSFVRMSVPAGGSVNLILAGERGGALKTAAQPQVIIFRTR